MDLPTYFVFSLQPSRHSKLEKADILEMTVKHLQTVQRQQLSTAVATDPAVLTKFRTGFSECATEVSRYVNHLENVDPAVKQRLMTHLNTCVSNLQQMVPFYSHYVSFMPERLFPEVKVGFQSDYQNGDENNNGSARIQIPNGVQLIPSRLPTGELALLVPQSATISANFPFFPPITDSSSRMGSTSAFTTVQRSHSPLLSPSTSTSSYGEESHHSEQYPQSQSPSQTVQSSYHQQHEFKVPEQSPSSSKSFSSSPETQKPQINSTTDRKSPPFLEPRIDHIRRETSIGTNYPESSGFMHHRQPLSVITDKYNRSSSAFSKRESLKRPHPNDTILIPDKRSKYQEPTSSTSSSSSVASSSNDPGHHHRPRHQTSIEDLSGKVTCSTRGVSNGNVIQSDADSAGPSATNSDMWRPW